MSSSGNNTKGRVLVADDDPAILRLVSAVLDVVMPHIPGPELLRYMRTEKRFNKIPVMMMTAEQDPKLSSDSFAAGAVVFLPKPFTTAQLQTMLRMLVGKAVSQG